MQFSESTLNNVRNLDIVDVISKFIPVKRQGANYLASCPFHDEKTPSFTISPSKQIYKCFGCGASGDSINFVMEYEGTSFYEAVKTIANHFAIPLHYYEATDEQLIAHKEKIKERSILQDAINFCRDFYENNSPAEYLTDRQFSKETIEQFQLGFAPKGNVLLNELKEKGKDLETFEKVGVIKKGEKGYYDTFQNRVIIPIQNQGGYITGFTGRNVEKNSKYPKYYNSPENELYQKGDILFGLNHAYKYIMRERLAYLVEGNADVIQMHNKGLKNTVAQGGTSLTDNQIKLLKKVTNHVCIIADNDESGLKALEKNALNLLENELFVSIIIPNKKDADEDLRGASKKEVQAWQDKKVDFLSDYFLKKCQERAKGSPVNLMTQIKTLGSTIELIQDEDYRKVYYEACKKEWRDFAKSYKLKSQKARQEEQAQKENTQNKTDDGFITKNGCYVIIEKGGKEIPISNFTMEVLFFIEANNEPKYFIKLRHKQGLEKFATVTTDDFTTVNSFAKAIERRGGFFFTGNLKQLYQMKEKFIFGVGRAYEHSVLGQQKDYYVWANGILFNNQFFKANRHGVVKIKREIIDIDEFEGLEGGTQVIIKNKEFVLNSAFDTILEYEEENLIELIDENEVAYFDYVFLPASSKTIISKEDQDQYSDIRKFSYNNKANVSFAKWAELMDKSYTKNNGKVGVAYCVMALFRDIIFEYNNNWNPLLFAFGLPQKGKSKFAESLASIWGKPMEDGINLEGGSTATGIRRFMAGRKNALVWLNEYKNDLPVSTIGMLKSLADGSGKLQGVKTMGNETSHYKPLSSAVICGQDLPTKDPALLSRSVVCEFDGTFGDYEAYEELKELEKTQEVTSVVGELLKYRSTIKRNYRKYAKIITHALKEYCKREKITFEDRTFLNLASLLTPMAILREEQIDIPFSYTELETELIEKAKYQETIRRTADEVEQFFTTVISLVNKDIYPNIDFKIQEDDDGNAQLLLRLKRIHSHYLTQSKKMGTSGYHLGVIKAYLEKHPSYMGSVKSASFGGGEVNMKRIVTSAMIFDYNYLKEHEIEFE